MSNEHSCHGADDQREIAKEEADAAAELFAGEEPGCCRIVGGGQYDGVTRPQCVQLAAGRQFTFSPGAACAD